MNKREANQQARAVAHQVERRQDFVSGTSNLAPTVTSTVPQPKLDATDRRYIEAQNEDKGKLSFALIHTKYFAATTY